MHVDRFHNIRMGLQVKKCPDRRRGIWFFKGDIFIILMTNLSRKFYVFGLDQSGKSVFVNYLTTGELKAILPPTLAFSITDLQFKKLKIVIWDAPGQKIFRNLWLRHVNRSDLIFYIVDASDRNRFAEAKEELD